METRIDEIGDGIFRLSTHIAEIVPPEGFGFNQFLIRADEPLLFHCGTRALFPLVSAALGRLMPVEDSALDQLRPCRGGRMRRDEPLARRGAGREVVYSRLGSDVSVNDLADRPPRILDEDESLDLGGKRIRLIPTPHVPHGWEAQVLYEETGNTLFCGDLLTHFGDRGPVTGDDIVEAAMASEDLFGATSLGPLDRADHPPPRRARAGLAGGDARRLVPRRWRRSAAPAGRPLRPAGARGAGGPVPGRALSSRPPLFPFSRALEGWPRRRRAR